MALLNSILAGTDTIETPSPASTSDGEQQPKVNFKQEPETLIVTNENNAYRNVFDIEDLKKLLDETNSRLLAVEKSNKRLLQFMEATGVAIP
jgi:hypothetical protein